LIFAHRFADTNACARHLNVEDQFKFQFSLAEALCRA